MNDDDDDVVVVGWLVEAKGLSCLEPGTNNGVTMSKPLDRKSVV